MTDQVTITPESAAVISPQLINEIFDKDPLSLSDQDIDTTIAYMRQQRQNYLQAPAEKAAKKAAGKATKPSVVPTDGIDLKQLGLEI